MSTAFNKNSFLISYMKQEKSSVDKAVIFGVPLWDRDLLWEPPPPSEDPPPLHPWA